MTRAISYVTPMAFDVDQVASKRESLELLFCCEGRHPEPIAPAQEFKIMAGPAVANCPVFAVSLPDLNSLGLQVRLALERADMSRTFNAGRGTWGRSVQVMAEGAVEFPKEPLEQSNLLTAINEGLENILFALAREVEMRDLRNRYASLTRRERQVMALSVFGLSNKQISEELGISEVAAKSHRRQMMQKMQTESFADLMKIATRLGPHRAFNRSRPDDLTAIRK